MRTGLATIITTVLMLPSLVDVAEGRLSIDGFGLRFLAAVLFAILATWVIAVFVKAVEPRPEPKKVPQRRKTDKLAEKSSKAAAPTSEE